MSEEDRRAYQQVRTAMLTAGFGNPNPNPLFSAVIQVLDGLEGLGDAFTVEMACKALEDMSAWLDNLQQDLTTAKQG